MSAPYRLVYREPGKRHNSTRWAKRLPVASVQAACEFLNAHRAEVFPPFIVETPGNQWQDPQTVAILR